MRVALALPMTTEILSRAATACFKALRAVVAAAWRARQNRAAAQVLASLDHRMLADVGLNHADLRDALSQPAWSDPTELLVRRARDRRRRVSAKASP